MAYYNLGNSFYWFIARAVDIKDPEKMGRIKIRVIHDQTGELGKVGGGDSSFGISDDDLLWAWPISAIQSASLAAEKLKEDRLEGFNVPDWIDAVGLSPTGIAVGTYVFGFYLDGKEQNVPMIFGTYHKKSVYPEPPTDENTGELLQLKPGESQEYSDIAGLALGINTLENVKSSNQLEGEYVKEPASKFKAEYPYNITYTTKSGHVLELDDTSGEERLHIYHKSGSYTEIDKDGETVTKSVGNNYTIIAKDNNVLVSGNTTVEVGGNVKVYVSGNTEIYTENNTLINTKKDTSIVTEGNTDITTKKNTNISSEGNTAISTQGDTSISSKGDTSISTKGKTSITSDRELDISSDLPITVKSKVRVKVSAPKVKI